MWKTRTAVTLMAALRTEICTGCHFELMYATLPRVTLYSFASKNCLLPLAILLAMHLIPMKGETVGTLGHQNWAYMTVGCMCMVGGHYLGS